MKIKYILPSCKIKNAKVLTILPKTATYSIKVNINRPNLAKSKPNPFKLTKNKVSTAILHFSLSKIHEKATFMISRLSEQRIIHNTLKCYRIKNSQ